MSVTLNLPYDFHEYVFVGIFDRPFIDDGFVSGSINCLGDAEAVSVNYFRAVVVDFIELVAEIEIFHSCIINLFEYESGLLDGIHFYCHFISVGKQTRIAFRAGNGICESAFILSSAYRNCIDARNNAGRSGEAVFRLGFDCRSVAKFEMVTS